jgi:hypothetical protein
MNRTFTELTTVLMMTALCTLPLAGQEKVAVEMEPAVCESVQLRADGAEAWPDSAIQYSPNGEKRFKHVYTGENKGRYAWINNAWVFYSLEPNNIFYLSEYNQAENNRLQGEISCESTEGEWCFTRPGIFSSMVDMIYTNLSFFKTAYDANGKLTSFKYHWEGGSDDNSYEIKVYYNAENNPLLIEYWNPNGKCYSKNHYEYNDYGYATRIYTENEGGAISLNHIGGYDAQGKCLVKAYYVQNEIARKWSYTYYDEHHFSSTLLEVFEGNSGGGGRREFTYRTDGKLEAYYFYDGDDKLSTYYILYYNTLDNPGNANEPLADMRIWSYAGTLHVRTAQSTTLHVYTLTGVLYAQQTLPAGETTLLLPPGMYIVKVGDTTEKVVIGK